MGVGQKVFAVLGKGAMVGRLSWNDLHIFIKKFFSISGVYNFHGVFILNMFFVLYESIVHNPHVPRYSTRLITQDKQLILLGRVQTIYRILNMLFSIFLPFPAVRLDSGTRRKGVGNVPAVRS